MLTAYGESCNITNPSIGCELHTNFLLSLMVSLSVSSLDSWFICSLAIGQAIPLSSFVLASAAEFVSQSLFVLLLLLVSQLTTKAEKLQGCIKSVWEIEEANFSHAHRHHTYIHSTHVY